MHLRSIVVIGLVLLAGCTAPQADEPPAPASTDRSVTLSNEYDTTYTVTVHAIPPDAEGIELTYKNGSIRAFDEPVDDIPREMFRNVTALSVDGDSSREVTLAPNRGIGLTLEGVPPRSSVVYIVYSEAGLRATQGPGIVQCQPDTERVELTVTILSNGSLDSRLSCTDESTQAVGNIQP